MSENTLKIRLTTPALITGKGDSIWEASDGTMMVDLLTVGYRGEKQPLTATSFRAAEYLPKGYRTRQHISVDVSGPELLPFWYTDSGVEEGVLATFKAELLAQTGADDAELSWSEQGMQGEGMWNFDVNLFWKS